MKNKVTPERIGTLNQFTFSDSRNSYKQLDVPEFEEPFMIATDASLKILGNAAILRFKGRLGKPMKVLVPLDQLRAYAAALDIYETNSSPLNSKTVMRGIDSAIQEISP